MKMKRFARDARRLDIRLALAAATVLLLAPPPLQPQENGGSSAILVNSYGDLNGNGVRDEEEPPLELGVFSLHGLQSGAWEQVGAATTGPDGTLVFPALQGGDYMIVQEYSGTPEFGEAAPAEQEVILGAQADEAVDYANLALSIDANVSYALNFSAAEPEDYMKLLPSEIVCPAPSGSQGTAEDPIDPPPGQGVDEATFGYPKQSIESLAPATLGLGQIVPFEILIRVSGDTAADGGAISFVAGWNTEMTSGAPFGYDAAYGVLCAFVDTSDGANLNLDGDEKVDSYSWLTTADEIQGTFGISGLDDGDEVVVEIWLVLANPMPFPPKVSGNVPSRLISAVSGSGAAISTGSQTVPVQRVQEFITSNADLSIVKSDDRDPVYCGARFTYTVEVTNNSADTVANQVTVTDTLDPDTSFVSAVPSPVDQVGQTLTFDLGFMLPGETAAISITVDVLPSASTTGAGGTGPCDGTEDLCNNASVSALTADPDPSNNSASEPTGVLCPTSTPTVTPTETPTITPTPTETPTETPTITPTPTETPTEAPTMALAATETTTKTTTTKPART